MLRPLTPVALGVLLAAASARAPLPAQARPARAPALVRVEPAVYRAAVTADSVTLTVVASLTNHTRDTLWLAPHLQHRPYPPEVELERWDGRRWRAAWGSGRDFGGMGRDAPRLAPGAARVDTIRVWGSRRPATFPAFWGRVPGTYRLRYRGVYRRFSVERQYRDSVGPALLTSNAFRVTSR